MVNVDISKMSRYDSPIHSAMFPHLTIILLVIGLLFTAAFLVFGVNASKKNRNILKELLMSGLASGFLGFGTVFLLLWVGIYV